MRINCTIDNIPFSLNVNANKPLSKILEENIETFSSNNKCLGAGCGNCVVLVNGVCSLSCLIPAFKISNSNIMTYEGFSKTRNCHDIERAYKETGINPCRLCYASKTLLIESVLQSMEGLNNKKKNSISVVKELSLNTCKCLDNAQLEKVVQLAFIYRSRRRGKA